MTNDKNEILEKRMRRIERANGFRLLFMVIAVTMLIIIIITNKFLDANDWYPRFRSYAIMFTAWDILFMVVSSFVKIFFTMQYNIAVKKINKE